jgi:hypothetical protein
VGLLPAAARKAVTPEMRTWLVVLGYCLAGVLITLLLLWRSRHK